MRKTKHFFLALLAVSALSTAWASGMSGNRPDKDPAKTSYDVSWSGPFSVVYNGAAQTGLTATYNDGTEHQLTITYSKGSVTTTAPVDAGSWSISVSDPANPSASFTNASGKFLQIEKAVVTVVGAEAQTYKFEDGGIAAIVTNPGQLKVKVGNTTLPIYNGETLGHNTSARFNDPNVGTNKVITFSFSQPVNDNAWRNYQFDSTSKFFTNHGVIVRAVNVDNNYGTNNSGFAVTTEGYVPGSSNVIDFTLANGTPDKYRIDFVDASFTDVPWKYIAASTTGTTGAIKIDIPANTPEGTYYMDVYFGYSAYPNLESQNFPVAFNVTGSCVSSGYIKALFNNVIALDNTCGCFAEPIQWYHNGNPIPGANKFYYREPEGNLNGNYHVTAIKDGASVILCPQADFTLVGTQQASVAAYPNPTVDDVTITIDGTESDLHTFTVVSTLGVEMMRGIFQGDSFTFDMSRFQRGNYMVNVDGNVVRVIKN